MTSPPSKSELQSALTITAQHPDYTVVSIVVPYALNYDGLHRTITVGAAYAELLQQVGVTLPAPAATVNAALQHLLAVRQMTPSVLSPGGTSPVFWALGGGLVLLLGGTVIGLLLGRRR